MSIASEVTRLQNAKTDIKTAIEAKGVTVPSDALLDSYDSYIAQISGGGSTGLEYEEGTYQPSQDIDRPTISFSKTHTNLPVFVAFFDTTGTIDQTTDTNMSWTYVDNYKLWGSGVPYNSSAYRYAIMFYIYRASSGSSLNTGNTQFQYDSDNTGSGNQNYPRYWVTNTEFKPGSNSSSRYWRAGRTYKWIAIWK